MAASASAFMLLKQDGAKLSEFFWPVGQEAQDCVAVVSFERDHGAFESPGVFEFVGDLDFVDVSKAVGELQGSLCRARERQRENTPATLTGSGLPGQGRPQIIRGTYLCGSSET